MKKVLTVTALMGLLMGCGDGAKGTDAGDASMGDGQSVEAGLDAVSDVAMDQAAADAGQGDQEPADGSAADQSTD